MEKRIRNGLLGLAAVAVLAGSVALYSRNYGESREPVREEQSVIENVAEKKESDIKLSDSFVFREGPVYSDSRVPTNMCSRYVRIAAEDLFGVKYPSVDAWDIRDDSRVKEINLDSTNTLEKLANEGRLKPGMLIGVYNSTSRYNARAKEDGAGYTHVMLYLGQKNGELLFADKFGKSTRPKISLNEIKSKGLQPREVMFIENN